MNQGDEIMGLLGKVGGKVNPVKVTDIANVAGPKGLSAADAIGYLKTKNRPLLMALLSRETNFDVQEARVGGSIRG